MNTAISCIPEKHMIDRTFKESDNLELKKSTSELKEAIISIAAILNKHHKGEIYFGIKNDGSVVGQDKGEKIIETTQKIIELIKANPHITRNELAQNLGLTPDGIKYHVDKLKRSIYELV